MSKTQAYLTWGIRLLLALAFGAAGGAKLLSVPAMVDLFTNIGMGQWFYVTGGIEVLGAVLMLVPSTGLAGALLLGGTMVGAVATHLFLIGGSPAPALTLGVLCTFVAISLWPSQGAPLLSRQSS